MSRVLVIGCGGVANVAIRKCCMVPEVFSELCIASRTKSKCDELAAELAPPRPRSSPPRRLTPIPWRSFAPSSTATSPIWL